MGVNRFTKIKIFTKIAVNLPRCFAVAVVYIANRSNMVEPYHFELEYNEDDERESVSDGDQESDNWTDCSRMTGAFAFASIEGRRLEVFGAQVRFCR